MVEDYILAFKWAAKDKFSGAWWAYDTKPIYDKPYGEWRSSSQFAPVRLMNYDPFECKAKKSLHKITMTVTREDD